MRAGVEGAGESLLLRLCGARGVMAMMEEASRRRISRPEVAD